MTIYIEYVLIDNFFIDYLLLKATFIITGNKVIRFRQILGATFGALCALLFPLLEINVLLLSLLKICVGVLIVAISNRFYRIKSFYLSCVIFIFLTFLMGGIILGLSSIFNIEISSEFSIAIMILPVYFFIKVILDIVKYFYSRKHIENCSYNCTISFNDKEVNVNGFLDTGNGLYYKDKPIIVIDKNYFIKNFGEKVLLSSFITFTYYTSSGVSKMPLFTPKKIIIKDGLKEYFNSEFYLGVGSVPDKILLLHPSLMEGNYEQTAFEAKEDNREAIVK